MPAEEASAANGWEKQYQADTLPMCSPFFVCCQFCKIADNHESSKQDLT